MAACIRGPRSVQGSVDNLHKANNVQYKSIIQIYTDWANHYLEKARCKKLIQDLQQDVTDGVLLADLVESVTGHKVPDINRKPKNSSQMGENVKACLGHVERIGVTLDGITAKDIREGNLKAILGLFFALSKHKQQQKQQHLQLAAERDKLQRVSATTQDMHSRLPSPFHSSGQAGSGTAAHHPGAPTTNIPTSVLRAHTSGGSPLKCASASSSRSTSPSHSFIPTPRNPARTSLTDKQLTNARNTGSGVRTPSAISSPYCAPSNKNSMLDKLKLFNPKDKNKAVIGSTKRTSSSSGFSSARSERSDSSTSLYCDIKSSIAEKKEISQNDLNIRTGLKKKIVKTSEIKVSKAPSKTLVNKTNHLVTKPEKTSTVDFVEKHPEAGLTVVETGTNIPATEMEDCIKTVIEPPRGIGGSGIPKPTAAVKGTSKPTHSVAPMQFVTSESTVTTTTITTTMTAVTTLTTTSVDKKVEPSSTIGTKVETTFSGDKVTTETSHVKQTSFGDEDESMIAVKPMQPLLRGYKRSIAIAPRILHNPPDRMAYKNMSMSPECFTRIGDRGSADGDYSNITSGYMSDGDILQSPAQNDVNDGYMSEGGASFYAQRLQERALTAGQQNFLTRIDTQHTPSRIVAKQKTRSQGEVKSREAVSDALGTVSSDELQHLKRGSVTTGSGGSSRGGGPYEAPLSPPEPQPVVYRVVGSRSHIKKSDSSQQTDNSAFSRQVTNSQWKKYVESVGGGARMPELSRGKTDLEVVRPRDKRAPQAHAHNGLQRKPEKKRINGSKEELGQEEFCNGERKTRDSKGKVRGVPPSFGYVKRPISGGGKGEPRTAQVSAVPRTKVKVSGGTQTDLKSYSVGGTSGAQLSASVRERLLLGSQSLPKPRTDTGSLSDSNYADLVALSSPYSAMYRHTAAYTSSLPTRATAVGMVEADSIESLPAQLHHRASLTHTRLLAPVGSPSPSPTASNRLSRSNSISYLRDRTFPRSTKSEKLYPSMLQRSEEVDPYYSIPYGMVASSQHSSQPTSPTPSQMSHGTVSRFNYPVSPISASASSHGISRASPYIGLLSKMNSKDDDVHGSAVSLVSTASSLYSTPEEKQAHELRKLRKELGDAQEKVHTLTSQLSTNAHVVSAFEQSLSNMTQRLQHLTATAEKKDSELMELRQTIELLRKQSVEAGLTSAHMQSMSPSQARRHTINTTESAVVGSNIARQLSTDSVSSINSLSSACSLSSAAHNQETDKKKKRGWLRSSFNKAFSRTKKNRAGSLSDVEDGRGMSSDLSAPSSPLLNTPHQMNGEDPNTQSIKGSQSSSATCFKCSHVHSSSAIFRFLVFAEENGKWLRMNAHESIQNMSQEKGKHLDQIYERESGPEVVEELRKQLREKDLVLTDIRLEALSSAHQLESLKDTVIKMRNEMLNLKQDNERLQRIVTSKSLTSSQSSLPISDNLERRFSMTDAVTSDERSSLFICDPEGKRVCVSVYLGSHGSYHKYVEESQECAIGMVSISGKTKWEMLDAIVRRVFKEYCDRIDPLTSLGLGVDCIWSYHVGEVVRYKDGKLPDLLPCGYLVGETSNITICLKGALHSGSLDALAFETLIPKSIVQRYMSLLTEHRRIILCGPSGTGKSYLANKLAEFLVLRAGKDSTAEAVATFNVDHKSSKELRQYLAHVAEQCETSASELPSVIILDNLHHASSLGEVFNGFLNAKYAKCPYIIGTMNQATCSTTNLQLHHNFRWVLCANHMEPVKGFLGRYLNRRLVEAEVRAGCRSTDLARIVDWIPRIWQHLNQFLETHSSSDVTIGPRLFLSCPIDLDGSQVWFTDLWNYSLVPYLLEAVREGLQLYGCRAQWDDPTHYICQTYPWVGDAVHGGSEALIRLRPEDVGYDHHQDRSNVGGVGVGASGSSIKSLSSTQSDTDADPLLNMLMRLQEAANYSSPHSNDSDSNTNSDNMNSSGIESTL